MIKFICFIISSFVEMRLIYCLTYFILTCVFNACGGGEVEKGDVVPLAEDDNSIPISTEELYIEHLKEQLASQKNSTVDVQVSLKEWYTVEEIRPIFEGQSPQIYQLHARSNVGAKTLKTTVVFQNSSISEEELIEHFKKLSTQANLETLSTQAQAILSKGMDAGVITSSFKAVGNASSILSWWEKHSDEVRAIQILGDGIGRAQSPLLPGEEL